MSFHSLDVAVDLIVGMTVEARRRLIRQPVAPRAYIDEMLECTFRGLDMAPATLAEARATAWTHILAGAPDMDWWRSEEHTSELQSLMRISYAVFCLKKNNRKMQRRTPTLKV